MQLCVPGDQTIYLGLVPRLRLLVCVKIFKYRSSTYSRDLKECMQERSSNDVKEAATSSHAGLITKHFLPRMSVEEHKKAYALMIRAHCAALLPPLVNDIPEYREYIEFISRGSYVLPHRTKTTDLHDEAACEIVDKVYVLTNVFIDQCQFTCMHAYNTLLQIRASALRASSISLTTDSVLAHTGESYVGVN